MDREVRIQVNNQSLTVSANSPLDTILLQYVIVTSKAERSTTKVLLPAAAYRWDPLPTTIEDKGKYTAKSLLEDIPDDFDAWLQQWNTWTHRYPQLSAVDQFVLMTLKKYPLHVKDLESIFKTDLPNMVTVFNSLSDSELTILSVNQHRLRWRDNMTQWRTNQEERLRQSQKLQREIKNMKSVEWTPFVVDKITYQYLLNYMPDMPLIIPFQEAHMTTSVPYLILKRGDDIQYRVQDSLSLNTTWIVPPVEDGLHFHVNHHKAHWKLNHTLEIEYIKSIDMDTILQQTWDDLLFTFTQPHQDFNVADPPVQIQVRGTFHLKTPNSEGFHPWILADVFATNSVAQRHVWMGESHQPVSKNTTHVPLTYSYDALQETNRYQRLKAVIKQEKLIVIREEDEKSKGKGKGKGKKAEKPKKNVVYTLHVQVSRAPDLAMVEAFQQLLGKLVFKAGQSQQELIKLYTGYDQSLKRSFDAMPVHIKEKDTKDKTRKRLKMLLKLYPQIFGGSTYSRECGSKFQPFVIPEDEVQTYIEAMSQPSPAYPEGGPGASAHMEFEQDGELVHYGCQSIASYQRGERIAERFIGLKVNKTATADQYPLIPCCYIEDQYMKEKSKLFQYVQARTVGGEMAHARKRKGLGYVLKANKRVYQDPDGDHRRGLLPMYIEWIYRNAGVTQTIQLPESKKDNFAVMRLGVPESPSSLLHALELAFNEDVYRTLTYTERIQHVNTLRQELATYDLTFCKQELGSMTLEEARNELMNVEVYFDPGRWIRLVEQKYKVHLFLYQLSMDLPNGELFMPFHDGPYLHFHTYSRAIALIVHHGRFKHLDPQIEIITELIAEKDKKIPRHVYVMDYDSPIHIAMSQVFQDGYIIYRPHAFKR